MPTSGQRRKLLFNLAMYFAERGEICSPKEFDLDKGNRPKMVKSSTVNKYFGAWSSMVRLLKKEHSDILENMQPKPEKKVEFVDPLKDYFAERNIEAEPDPLEQLRASTTEK